VNIQNLVTDYEKQTTKEVKVCLGRTKMEIMDETQETKHSPKKKTIVKVKEVEDAKAVEEGDSGEEMMALGKMETDQRFATFFSELAVEGRTQSDNPSQQHWKPLPTPNLLPNLQKETAALHERIDSEDVVRRLRADFDTWLSKLEGRALFLEKQVVDGVGSMAHPETAPLQDIFKSMANKAGMHWDPSADPLLSKDAEQAATLFLAAPTVRHRVEKLKVDGGLLASWDRELRGVVMEKRVEPRGTAGSMA